MAQIASQHATPRTLGVVSLGLCPFLSISSFDNNPVRHLDFLSGAQEMLEISYTPQNGAYSPTILCTLVCEGFPLKVISQSVRLHTSTQAFVHKMTKIFQMPS
jgi:hypothetical protein